MSIIKPDWGKFRAKFSENPQKNFEWLCYLLFCIKFNKPLGIFRYKNQSGIETNPIKVNNELVGWQAKFYGTKLSDNKEDLIKMVTNTKRDYPDVTKIIFYSNQEWGQGRSKNPQTGAKINDPIAKREVEKIAEDEKIEIKWKTASFFESPFVAIDNKMIAQHFFSLDKSIIDLLNEKQEHNEAILNEIHTIINFNDQKIEIDRSEVLQNIEKELNNKQIIIVSGVGGVGKTSVIKKFYKKIEEKTPFYLFKANEFNVNNVNDPFRGLNFSDFIDFHRNEKIKIVVIDSAEKLLDLQNTDIFKEFLSTLIKNDWKIIFTTRNNYLEDLNYEFIELHKIIPFNLEIQNLSQSELENISVKYNFSLPDDSKLLQLIKNPFYLNEYLNFYTEEDIGYFGFKERLWNKLIRKSEPARETIFLKTAFLRANQGQFFVNPDFDPLILNKLYKDGILGYETGAGYFITHDIYEEWALEKIIESAFINKQNNKDFFGKIGESLSIRRSFRNWVSEKLLLKDVFIKQFIEEIIQDVEIESFWKDEILVSVLLSDYSETFFELFKDEILKKDQKFLEKIAFLLRIACKEVDNDYFKELKVKDKEFLSAAYFFTKPKGRGWESFIQFVFDNLNTIKIENVNFIFPVIHDWNSKFREGKTTRMSGLIALKYYQWQVKEDKSLDKEVKGKILQTILYSASEIKNEFVIIFDEILNNKWRNYRDPYYDLVKVILTNGDSVDGINVINILPDYVLKLADLFWFKIPTKNMYYDPMDNDGSFCLERSFECYPSSSLQTPIYWLLHSSLQKTIDFILDFTNKSVECFVKSDLRVELNEEIYEIDVFIENGKTNKQYINNRIWNIYRATEVSPDLLQSIHMALERFFLETAKIMDSKWIEQWLFYLLRNTKSASITAIIVSIVLAFPNKTFNIAAILFQTKEFFFYDTHRFSLENRAEGLYSIAYGFNRKRTLHQDERIKTCQDKHRKMSLEHLILNYQLFRDEKITAEEAENRQKIIWAILDEYYKDLPDKSEEKEFDKTWRLYLARMDRRKMTITTEEKDNQIQLNLNPEIDSELKQFSENSITESSDMFKHVDLNLWASYKVKEDDRYKEYEKYNNNPKLVFKEAKKVIEGFQEENNYDFFLFNRSIPGRVCSILLRDYFGKLSKEERIYCKDIILELASIPLRQDYMYQIGDGVEESISALSILLKEFTEEKDNIKVILLLNLLNPNSMGLGREFCDNSKEAIRDLWNTNFDDAQSLLFGYLLLKPRYEKLRSELRKKNYQKNVYEVHEIQLIKEFVGGNEKELKEIINNEITINDLNKIESLDFYVLKTAFQLIPSKTNSLEHKQLAQNIISIFAKKLLSTKREDNVDYLVKIDFLEKLADFILNSQEKEIHNYLKPFIENFNSSEAIADLFQRFIYAEDRLMVYNKFWKVWNLFYEKVVELCENGDNYYNTKKIIKSYLLVEIFWKDGATEWHALKETDKSFFRKVTTDIGYCPSVLYSISKLLNSIGSIYLKEGISWISGMLTVNKNLWADELDKNTIYYLENIVRKYAFMQKEHLRSRKQLKHEFLVILDFLADRGSVIGYMLRENIL